ncbi:hypothetical protein ACNAN0_12355 [Agrilactobacillus fermenti]|uniref:hypothetical protein n=1 Tax=Agrilactobacillus fermenti TaxID=2586909 RepID=UPI003A5C24C4
MKLSKRFMGLFVALGALIIGTQPVNAAVENDLTIQPATNIIFSSGNQPTPIYSDPETNVATKQHLNTGISEWKVIREARIQDHIVAQDLGDNQWVKTADGVNLSLGQPTRFLEVFSAAKPVPIYSDALGLNKIGELNPSISEWRILRVAYGSGTYSTRAIELGQNQWVLFKDVTLINDSYYFKAGEPLYDRLGHTIGAITATMNYKIFGALTINGETYVKLGTNNQWVKYRSGSLFLS